MLYGHYHYWFGEVAWSPMCVMLIQKKTTIHVFVNSKKKHVVTVMMQMNNHNHA